MHAVPDDGTGHERLVIIGEAPADHEVAEGRPFVGPSGAVLAGWMRSVGLTRRDAYWTNVYPFQAPGNKIERVTRAELAPHIPALHARLRALRGPALLVPMGNVALRAVLGTALPKRAGIASFRGSILGVDVGGATVKTIPTIHPAATFQQPAFARRCRADWARIARELAFPELRLPSRTHHVAPTYAEVRDFCHEVQGASAVALDIETPHALRLERITTKRGTLRVKKVKGPRRITCLALSIDPSESLTIPLTVSYWGDATTLASVWALLRDALSSQVPKVTQNGTYDYFYLSEDHGIEPVAWEWDTMAEHHVLDPLGPHTLAYMASVDTRQPFWKHMKDAKDDDEAGGEDYDPATFWTYNGIDACVTLELHLKYKARLERLDRLEFYRRHYRDLLVPILAVMRHGLRMDPLLRSERFAALQAQGHEIAAKLAALNEGVPLVGAKGAISSKRLATFLYEKLGLPVRRDRKTKRVTTDEVTVRKFVMHKNAKVRALIGESGPLILTHRRLRALSQFYQEKRVDPDGRFRFTLGFDTVTGRFNSKKNPRGTGSNGQNQDRETRDVFIPNPGCVFLECDLSQAEDRIVKAMAYAISGNEDLLARARAMPWENDEHKRAAVAIFGIPLSAVTPDQRYLGKRARHASNYGMQGAKLSEAMLKDGVVATPDECQAMIEAIHAADPEIARWQAEVRRRLMADSGLVNSWGRRFDIRDLRMDDDLFRAAYAFNPQSEVPALVNQWGWLPFEAERLVQGWQARLHLQGHDSLLWSVPPDEVWEVMRFVAGTLERPRTYWGVELTIPVEWKVGRTWAGDVAWKRPPTRDEVHEAVNALRRGEG